MRLDHVGIVVDDLDEAKRFLGEVLGLPLRQESGSGSATGVRTAFFRCGEVEVEVLEMLDPERRRQRLGDGCQARIEHLAIEVDDLEATMAALRALGVEGPQAALQLSGRAVWPTRAETSDGVVYHFTQAAAGAPAAG